MLGIRLLHSLLPLFTLASLTLPATAQDPPSEETIKFFKTNCTSCHTIGGGSLVGPDLKGILDRQDRGWFAEFLIDPVGKITGGDPYGQKILREAKGVQMQPIPGMDAALAGKLIDLIVAEGAAETSRFAGVKLSDRPLTAQDIATGEALFNGQTTLMAGAPACISCHSVNGLAGLGGGHLGPDLTTVYSRMEGRKALGAWLSSPASIVMQPLYSEAPLDSEEVLALVAYLKDTASSGELEAKSTSLEFVLAGIGLAAFLMVLFDVLWRKRFRSVRRTLLAQR